VLENLPNLAILSKECAVRVPALANIVADYLLPMVVRNLGTSDNQVRKTAHTTLVNLIEKGLVSKLQSEIQVCPTILALSRNDSLVYHHIDAVVLMSKMVPLLGKDVTERVFLDRFTELCSNQMFEVRKACASNFGNFCAVVGKQSYEKVLLPTYINLCRDGIWGVRKACAEVSMSMSCACDPATRRTVLAPVFAQLLQDECRWVRITAFQTLGPFISTFADPTITSLAYNNVGELVLKNTDGSEFKLNSGPHPIEDVNQLICLKLTSYSGDEHVNSAFMKGFYGTEDSEINVLNVIDNTPEENAAENVSNELDLPVEDVGEHALESSMKELNLHKGVENLDELVDNDIVILNTLTNGEHQPNQFTNVNIDNDDGDNGNVDNKEQNCDDVFTSDENLTDAQLPEDLINNIKNNNEVANDSVTANESTSLPSSTEGKDEESLDLFNSYNYWYVPPDMPLDFSIFDADSINSEETANNSISHDLNSPFKIKSDDTYIIRDLEPEKLPQQAEVKEPQQHIVPQLLIDYFISMTDPNIAEDTDDDIAYHCAYSLPAVALTLGSNNWHLLKDTVETLAASMQYKVRRTLACSLHELAVILGPDIASSFLTPIFNKFIKDEDEVRIGIIKHLAIFLQSINLTERTFCLPRLSFFLQNNRELNWRFRHELASQLLLAVSLFPPTEASTHIMYIAQRLLSDKVTAVREVALKLVCALLKHIGDDPTLTSMMLLKFAERFAHSKKWKWRQTFVYLCIELLVTNTLPEEQFASEVMPHLLDLSWDPVANVRLVVAKMIANYMINNESFEEHKLHVLLERLQTDKDRDVRFFAQPHSEDVNATRILNTTY